MEDDELLALRGAGLRELIPEDGLPFATDTGRPRSRDPELIAMTTREAMERVRWDYDPLKDAIVGGQVRVSDFFDAFEWSDIYR